MFFSNRRVKRRMKDPVRGVFRITGTYDIASSFCMAYTGVLTAPGIPAIAAERKDYMKGRLYWADLRGQDELPVLVDRADPSRFVILWSQVQSPDRRGKARSSARVAADRLNAASDAQSGAPAATPVPAEEEDQFLVVSVPDAALSQDELTRLKSTFELAIAVVTAVRKAPPMPGVPSQHGVLDITLEITKAGGSGYSAVMRVPFQTPRFLKPLSTTGTRFSARIDPDNPRLLVIDKLSLL